ncbi:monocarboxylate permease [Aspergillus lentulus]|uniref:Monocarboxylate permease n=1 Tax=Aspergillus lentulus TaxID=293939 RepID=A0ABQ1B5U7_ASPLE|nr:monocarboxylate permease [Aspergillus lentulus]GFF55802.1 monocarboxylate permease [Aspergillus lentulus]GFF92868.1 monocarboxylate permease [Aspergillus lentulus]
MNISANPLRDWAPPSTTKEGFANVARWIALDCDGEVFIYRKFSELAARNLLYLQCELLDLEKHFNELDSNDAGSDDMDIKDAARTWETLTQQCESGNKEAQIRKQVIVRLRAKLKEYHEALILQEGIMRLKQPNKRVLDAYRNWFMKPYPALGGQAKKALEISDDLVNLSTLPEADILSSTLRRYWPVNEEFSRDGLHRIGRFSEKSISNIVAIISTLLAAILLIGSITSLYFATTDAVKLGLVAVFTLVFALSVGLMTNARRAEIFAATAAYAAVLVVFVSGNISSLQE